MLHPSQTPTVVEVLFDRGVVLQEPAHEQLLLLLPELPHVGRGEPVAQIVVALVVGLRTHQPDIYAASCGKRVGLVYLAMSCAL
jgi:hypothetical protein